MSKRNRPRKSRSQLVKTVLQALEGDTEALDSLVLGLSPGEGVGVNRGRLAKILFTPKWRPPKTGEILNW